MLFGDLLLSQLRPSLLGRRAVDLSRILRARVPGTAWPLVVQFLTTLRCNLECAFCENPMPGIRELDDAEVRQMLRELCDAGMRKITFSGGEPLLVEGLFDWLDYVRSRGVFSNLITNGALVPKYIDRLSGFDLIVVSLHGLEERHDAIRGKGSHKRAVRAVELCHERGIEVWTSTTLSAQTREDMDFVIELTGRAGGTAIFQPVDEGYEEARDTVVGTLPDPSVLRGQLDYLLQHKEAGADIGTSARYLERADERGKGPRHPCRWAGRLFCTILPDGRVIPCNPLQTAAFEWKSGRELGYQEAMRKTPRWTCDGCGSGTPDLDALLSFRFHELM